MSNYAFSIKFVLDKRNVKNGNEHTIYMRVIVNREKAEFTLFMSANPEKFDIKTGRINKPTRFETYINRRLQSIEDQINMIRFNLEDEGIPVTAKGIKQRFKYGKKGEETLLLEFMQVVINEMSAKPQEYSPHVVRHYIQCRNNLRQYFKTIKLKDIAIEKFSRKYIDGFEHYLLTTPSEVTGKPLSRNTVNVSLKKLKSVFNNAIRKEIIQRNPFFGFKMVGEKSHRVALSYEEILAIANHPLGNNQSLQRVRDIFLWSCFTGLRYSDAINLCNDDIKPDMTGRLWIMSKQQKTGNAIRIPILAPAKVIYDRYETNRNITGLVLPSYSNQKINAYLKQIALMVGIKTNLTHHIGRHSYAILLMNNGVDFKIVSEMMGHYSIRTTEAYGKVTQTLLAKTADEVEAILK